MKRASAALLENALPKFDLVRAFASRDMSTRFRTSVMGWVWGLIQPLVQLLLFLFVFGIIFRVTPPPLGSDPNSGSFAGFLLVGIVTWNLFSQTITYSMVQLRGSAELLKKVYFPVWTPVVGGSLVQIVQTALEFTILFIFFVFLGNVGVVWLAALPILASLVLFSQGVGLILALLNAKYGDIQYIVGVVLSTFYFLTPILYPLSFVEDASPLAAQLVASHPMTWFVEAMHGILYSLTLPTVEQFLLLIGIGPIVFALCFFVFSRASVNLRMWL